MKKSIGFFFDGDYGPDANKLKKMVKAAQKNPNFQLFEIVRTDDEDAIDSHFILAENLKEARSYAEKEMMSSAEHDPDGESSLIPHTVRNV